jgi:beta-glucanase (GH16 family)
MKIMNVLIISLLVLLNSCSKGGEAPASNNVAPTNLTLVANVSTDNSGNVTFTATATNAVNYDFDFGNGVFQSSTTGIVTYKYPSSGNYTVNVVAKSQSNLTASKSIQITVSVGLSLIFSDEFDTPGAPDPSKWGYDIGTGSGGWGNNELQYYTNRSDNVVVSNGTLKIIAKKENYSGSAYTSARLLSQNKFSFKYGTVEARAKLPAGVGTWPAIWMLGNNITTAGWPNCGEIDIMEHKGSDLNKIFATLHHPGHSGGNGDGSTKVISNATTEFHLYKMEWNANTIKFYVDNSLFYTFANTSSLPFNQNFFLLLNFAMGGNFGGSVDPAFTNATFELDYIRVYQ